jgi:hypothetical protein
MAGSAFARVLTRPNASIRKLRRRIMFALAPTKRSVVAETIGSRGRVGQYIKARWRGNAKARSLDWNAL